MARSRAGVQSLKDKLWQEDFCYNENNDLLATWRNDAQCVGCAGLFCLKPSGGERAARRHAAEGPRLGGALRTEQDVCGWRGVAGASGGGGQGHGAVPRWFLAWSSMRVLWVFFTPKPYTLHPLTLNVLAYPKPYTLNPKRLNRLHDSMSSTRLRVEIDGSVLASALSQCAASQCSSP